MDWFILSFVCILGWGFADLFYKKGTDESDRYSHLKIAVWVGLVMGIVSLILIPFSESISGFQSVFSNAVKYLPASAGYILSMVIGYAGLRYLELSIVSPVQNASGAFSTVAMLVFFTVKGRITDFKEEFSALDIIGTSAIVVGVIMLAVAEKRLSQSEIGNTGKKENKKYRYGALALIFPVLYCLFDTLGTAADGIILDEESGLGLGEIDVLVLYGITFFTAGIVCYIFLLIKTKKSYNPFNLKTEWPKAAAAVAEQFGQVFYVFAMSSKPLLASPMVASYCIVSVIFSHLLLKEKLTVLQYTSIIPVIIGIVLLGISEGIS